MQIQKYQTYQWHWSLIIIIGLAFIILGIEAFGILQALYITAKVLYTAGGVLILIGLFYNLPITNPFASITSTIVSPHDPDTLSLWIVLDKLGNGQHGTAGCGDLLLCTLGRIESGHGNRIIYFASS